MYAVVIRFPCFFSFATFQTVAGLTAVPCFMFYSSLSVRLSNEVFLIFSLCTKDTAPLTFQACVMPQDCYTSDWSSWGPCSKTCRSSDLSPGYRLRSRVTTQIPQGGGKPCPVLEEKEACNIIGDLLLKCPR